MDVNGPWGHAQYHEYPDTPCYPIVTPLPIPMIISRKLLVKQSFGKCLLAISQWFPNLIPINQWFFVVFSWTLYKSLVYVGYTMVKPYNSRGFCGLRPTIPWSLRWAPRQRPPNPMGDAATGGRSGVGWEKPIRRLSEKQKRSTCYELDEILFG